MEEKKNELDSLKDNYFILRSKYGLPSYKCLNEDFNIEKVVEIQTDFLLREIRKCMVDKFFGYLKLIEEILHPVNSQMFVFSIIKSIGVSEKEKLTEIYKILSRQEVELLELDLDFSEQKEADFIIKHYEEWQKIKKDLLVILDVVKKNWDNKFENKGKSYFG